MRAALYLTRLQTIDPAQFATYNSVECVTTVHPFLCAPLTSHSVGAVFKMTVHAEPDLGLGMHIAVTGLYGFLII